MGIIPHIVGRPARPLPAGGLRVGIASAGKSDPVITHRVGEFCVVRRRPRARVRGGCPAEGKHDLRGVVGAKCACRLALPDAGEIIEIRARAGCRNQAREAPCGCAEPHVANEPFDGDTDVTGVTHGVRARQLPGGVTIATGAQASP